VALSLNRMVEEKYPDLHQRWTQAPAAKAFGVRVKNYPHLGEIGWNVVAQSARV